MRRSDPESRHEEAEDRADDDPTAGRAALRGGGRARPRADADRVVLSDAQLEVRAREVALHADLETLVLYVARQRRERVHEVALPSARPAVGRLDLGLATGVARHALFDRAGAAAGGRCRRDSPEEEQTPANMPAGRAYSIGLPESDVHVAEDALRELDAGGLELLAELRADAGRAQTALDLSFDVRRSARRRRCPACTMTSPSMPGPR